MTSRLLAALAASLVLLTVPTTGYSKDRSGDPPPGQERQAGEERQPAGGEPAGQDGKGAQDQPPKARKSQSGQGQSDTRSGQSQNEPSGSTEPQPTATGVTAQPAGGSSDKETSNRNDTAGRRKNSSRKQAATPSPAAPALPAPAPASGSTSGSAPAAGARRTSRAARGASSSTSRSAQAPLRPGAPLAAAEAAEQARVQAEPERRTARPQPLHEDPRASAGPADAAEPKSALSRRVTQLVEVVPEWLMSLLALLGVLTIAFGAFAIVTALRARRLEETSRRLTDDVSLLQSAVLPALPAQVGSALVSVAYEPTEGPAAGGDFYDAFALPDGRTGVIVGDVEGHGRPALPLTALVRYTVRSQLESGVQPRNALQAADTTLVDQLEGKLVTVVAAVYDPITGMLTYACAGHPPPVLLGLQQPRAGAATSPPIGSGTATGRRQVTVALPPGTAACFHTDGLAEVRLEDQTRLGFDGLADYLEDLGPDCSAEEIVALLLERHGQTDDMTACVLHPLPGAARPAPGYVEELEVQGRDLPAARRFLADTTEPDEADAALQEVRRLIVETGAAVLEAHTAPDGRAVVVRPRPARTTA